MAFEGAIRVPVALLAGPTEDVAAVSTAIGSTGGDRIGANQ